MSRHITVKARDYDNPDAPHAHKARFAGLSGNLNHTSETQLTGWKNTFQNLVTLYNSSPMAKGRLLQLEDFANKLTGMNTDHAEDQKKLFRLLESWKRTIFTISQGKEAILRTPPSDLLFMLANKQESQISHLGGLQVWNSLSESDQNRINNEIYQTICQRLGEDVFQTLSPEERNERFLFVWTGCSMHRSLTRSKAERLGWTLTGTVQTSGLLNS